MVHWAEIMDQTPVFVERRIVLDRSYDELAPQLANGVHRLGPWAADAYREGERISATIRAGDTPIARSVELRVTHLTRSRDRTVLTLGWRATGRTAALFPSMAAELILERADGESSTLALRGRYEPPGGKVGSLADRAVMHRVADASVDNFLANVADWLGAK